MKKHLLVTVSEQKSAWHGVRFLSRFFSNKETLKITLLYILPKSPELWEGERTYEMESQIDRLAQQYEIKGRKALEGARRELIQSGFKKEDIDTKLQIRKFSKVMDIIQEGAIGLYDAVVLGHRGLSWVEEVFDESLSKKLLQEKFNFPIWVCRRIAEGRKNILVCVDGSEPAYRIVDHVGFMLTQEKDHTVTLLLVKKTGEAAGEDPANILSKSEELLLNNGLSKDMISAKVIDSASVKKAVIKEAEEGLFAAVAVGRTGAGRGFFEKIFAGSLCNKLLKELEHSAVWISN